MHGRKTTRPRLWWCNAGFDLTLARDGSSGGLPESLRRAERELAWHFWPALAEGDALWVPEPPPAEFLAYLKASGLTPPRFVTDPDEVPGALFTPFGWNAEAVRKNRARAHPAAHPAPEAVRRVNSRAFGMTLERELFGDDACPAAFCAEGSAVDVWRAGAPPGRYLAKGNHGHAGIGQLRFELPAAGPDLPARLRNLCARHGGLVLEREDAVEREWGVLFRLGADGRVSGLRTHAQIAGPGGGFLGTRVAPEGDDAFPVPRDTVENVAAALFREGYFGPVGLDGYQYRDIRGFRKRLVSDLNARMTWAWPTHGLAMRFPGKHVAVLRVRPPAGSLPSTYTDLRYMLDKLAFDPRACIGIIWLLPLLPLSSYAVAILGESEPHVKDMQHMLAMRGWL